LPERKWSARKAQGPTLRQHETDVLAFLKARLKEGTRRAAKSRRKAAAAKLEEAASVPEETPAGMVEAKSESSDQQLDQKSAMERTGS
jgi:hypothetical protein